VTVAVSERDDALRRWSAAEERLYPVVMVRPDLYRTCVGLVRSLADHLEAVPDLDALVATHRAADPAGELGEAGIDVESLPPEIDLVMLRDAAYAVRGRELEQRAASEDAVRAIERASRAGEPTAVIWSRGKDERWPPHRRVEMALATGFAIVETTETSAETMEPLYVLEAVQLDPETGDQAADAPLAPRREFTDLTERRTAADELRQRLLRTP
jgi:hypothetical protein